MLFLFLPLFFAKSFSAFSSHLIEGGEEALFCGLTHSKDRKTVHLRIRNIILHYMTSPLILFLRNCLQSKFCPPGESWLLLPLSPLLQAKGASLGKKIR